MLTSRPSNDPQLMSYRSYLDSFLLPIRVGRGPDIEKQNTEVKKKRQALKRRFTEPGEPGVMFRWAYRASPSPCTLGSTFIMPHAHRAR